MTLSEKIIALKAEISAKQEELRRLQDKKHNARLAIRLAVLQEYSRYTDQWINTHQFTLRFAAMQDTTYRSFIAEMQEWRTENKIAVKIHATRSLMDVFVKFTFTE